MAYVSIEDVSLIITVVSSSMRYTHNRSTQIKSTYEFQAYV